MENATKALIIAGSILIGIILLSIFAYEMNFIANSSQTASENIRQKEVQKLNAKILAYANKGASGYLEIENAISVQEFATLCNLKKDWNNKNQGDLITIKLTSDNAVLIKNKIVRYYLPDDSENSIEELFMEMNEIEDLELYYFTFSSEGNNIKYENTGGRISEITLKMSKVV